MSSKQTVIVTGGTGFIGRHVVTECLKQGHDVIAIVRNLEKAKSMDWFNSVKTVIFDIGEKNPTFEFPENSVLIHCAWESVRDTLSQVHLEENYLHHYFFIKKMVESGVKKILVTGSCYEYGLQYGPVSATDLTRPCTSYGLAKDMLHKSLRMLLNKMPFDLIWARLFYLYGEGQDQNSIIPLFDSALQKGDKTFNMSFGEQLFDYLPVEMVAQQTVYLLKNETDGVFNICSGKPISLRRMLEDRMKKTEKFIDLNLGHYGYRKQDSIAIWGADPIADSQDDRDVMS